MSHQNSQAILWCVDVIEEIMITLDKPCLDAMVSINDNYHPIYEVLESVSNGGDNIGHGFTWQRTTKMMKF